MEKDEVSFLLDGYRKTQDPLKQKDILFLLHLNAD